MAWSSILPEYLSTVETWIVRGFLFLGIVTMGPWAMLLIYDFLLYVCRSVTYEVPKVGGRAQGRQRPRAPSLTERPSGHRRNFSFAVPGATSSNDEDGSEQEPRRRSTPLKRRLSQEAATAD